MTRPPTMADWSADSTCIDRYLASLDTLPLIEMGEATRACLSEFLFQAARNKVQSAIILTAPSVRSAAGADAKKLEAQRQLFLREAALFETAARLVRAGAPAGEGGADTQAFSTT